LGGWDVRCVAAYEEGMYEERMEWRWGWGAGVGGNRMVGVTVRMREWGWGCGRMDFSM